MEKEIEIKNHSQKEKSFAALLEKNANDTVDFILYSSREEKALKSLMQMKLLTFIQHYNRIMQFDEPMNESEMNRELQRMLTDAEMHNLMSGYFLFKLGLLILSITSIGMISVFFIF